MGSTSVDRALRVLLLVARADQPLRLADLARETGIPKGTLHGLLASLEQAGFLDRTDAGYHIGITAFEVGTAMPLSTSLRMAVGPALDDLAAATAEACHVGMLSGTDVVYLDRRDTGDGLRFATRPGQRIPAHSTGLGKAMLALLSDDVLVRLLPERLPMLTERTISTRDELLSQIAVARARGHALESGESTPGVCCIGMALQSPRGPIGISISVPVQRAGPDDLHARFAPELRAAIERVRAITTAHHWFDYDSEELPR